jgi:hypothetical protein
MCSVGFVTHVLGTYRVNSGGCGVKTTPHGFLDKRGRAGNPQERVDGRERRLIQGATPLNQRLSVLHFVEQVPNQKYFPRPIPRLHFPSV